MKPQFPRLLPVAGQFHPRHLLHPPGGTSTSSLSTPKTASLLSLGADASVSTIALLFKTLRSASTATTHRCDRSSHCKRSLAHLSLWEQSLQVGNLRHIPGTRTTLRSPSLSRMSSFQ
ncbi:hypothetical protein MRX96_039367 [Rhipicephalus microplus]